MLAEERQPAPDVITTPEDALAHFRAAEWEAWPPSPCPVPTNEVWAAETGTMPPSLRLAWLTMRRTKPELLELVRSLEEESTITLLEDWDRLAGYLRGFIDMVTCARIRLGLAWGASLADDRAGAQ